MTVWNVAIMGDPVGRVSTGWTRCVECGDYGELLPSPGMISRSPELCVWMGPVRTVVMFMDGT